MKKRWALMSALGLLAPVAVATPMLATSCGEDKKEVTKVDKPTAKTDTIKESSSSITTFKQWQDKIEAKDKIKDSLGILFSKYDGLDEKNVDSIKVEMATAENGDPQGGGSAGQGGKFQDKAITVTVKLKEGYAFNEKDNPNSVTITGDKLTIEHFTQG